MVTTVFPAYDWVCQVVGNEAERYDISMIADNGADLHSYQPTAADILKISQCDMLVYVGGESDRWVAEAAGQAKNKDMTVINLMESGAGHVLAEETVEGMKDDGHDHDGTGGHSHDEEQAADEHIWLSLRAADTMVGSIEEGLSGSILPMRMNICVTEKFTGKNSVIWMQSIPGDWQMLQRIR